MGSFLTRLFLALLRSIDADWFIIINIVGRVLILISLRRLESGKQVIIVWWTRRRSGHIGSRHWIGFRRLPI